MSVETKELIEDLQNVLKHLRILSCELGLTLETLNHVQADMDDEAAPPTNVGRALEERRLAISSMLGSWFDDDDDDEDEEGAAHEPTQRAVGLIEMFDTEKFRMNRGEGYPRALLAYPVESVSGFNRPGHSIGCVGDDAKAGSVASVMVGQQNAVIEIPSCPHLSGEDRTEIIRLLKSVFKDDGKKANDWLQGHSTYFRCRPVDLLKRDELGVERVISYLKEVP
jgi:hypothetical protein